MKVSEAVAPMLWKAAYLSETARLTLILLASGDEKLGNRSEARGEK
jgi:hypothetical protein